jgi:hypothetical protein
MALTVVGTHAFASLICRRLAIRPSFFPQILQEFVMVCTELAAKGNECGKTRDMDAIHIPVGVIRRERNLGT